MQNMFNDEITQSIAKTVSDVLEGKKPDVSDYVKQNKDGQFDGPNGLIFDNKNQLYVVDHRNGRIQVFDESGNFIRKFKISKKFNIF